ncbi:hypothetical protein BDV26DRAFT_301436 [Aspergillus bertholletiae]|uniref:Uncharacterized protein n=1 Tax=Aspergillus bertholletiae TaxID=1226010 RepID=A0A5N7AVH1_9EURO|nr:hypothetical protein BDV26DRAFT_301436 [Aspergillus bertholletiae]
MEMSLVSLCWVASSGRKPDSADPERSLAAKSLSGYTSLTEDAITSPMDTCWSDFTVTPFGRNVTANTSQAHIDMSPSLAEDEMVLCSEKDHQETFKKKKIRAEAIAFIRVQTLVRLAGWETMSEELLLSQTREQYQYGPNERINLSIPSQVPTEPSIPSTASMDPIPQSKKKKKKKSKTKSKKRVLLDIGNTLPLSNQALNPSSPSVQSLGEEVLPSDGPSRSTRRQVLLEPNPHPCLHEADPKPGKDLIVSHATQSEHKATTECHKGDSTERVLSFGPREQTYRDALLGTNIMDHRGKRRVSCTNSAAKDDITEYNAALHAHPVSLTVEDWPSITGITPDEKKKRDTSPKTASSIDLGQEEEEEEEEVSGTRSPSCTQPSRLGLSIRKNKASMEKLPPIQEATGWTSAEPQGTPQTESSETEVSEIKNLHQTISTKAKAVVISQTKDSYAHPSSYLSLARLGGSPPTAQQYISTQKPEEFFWQLDTHGFPCAKSGCEKSCNLWDSTTVICPRCGPFSEIRYCCRAHLLEDVGYHWLYCGQMTFEHPCRENSIPPETRDGPPLVPCIHQYDTPERHRQAVYFNTRACEGDYFIFSDWADIVKAGFPENNVRVWCSSRVIYTIKFEDADEKDRFRRVLAACLFMTIEVTELVDYLFRLIRDKLRSQTAPIELEATLKYQFQQEFCVTIQPHITGERHACVTDWDGRSRRNCRDAVCRAEYRRLLGSPGGKCHCKLIDHLEGSYWILRAARTTHPEVTDVKARMRGEGFSDVADEDRREFRRGVGWDGAGTGDMEIEGISDD